MAKSGLKHIDVGAELTKMEWESEDSHEVVHGTSFPSSPIERQLFYRDDEHKWYIYNASAWVWLGGGGGGMSVHGNEYHDPDFEQQGVAASLVETHRTTATHTQPQPVQAHKTSHQDGGSDEISLAGLDGEPSTLATHKSLTTGVHGVGASTVESAAGSQAKVDAHKDLTTGVHGVGAGTIAKVGDIAVDSNLSSAAQDAINKRHTQNTDKILVDADADTKIQVEKTADEDKIRMDVKGVEAFLLEDNGILTLAKQSAVRVYLGTTQTVPDSTITIVNLDTKNFDIQGEFNTSTHKYTVSKAGIYIISGVITTAGIEDQKPASAIIMKNGSLYSYITVRQSAPSPASISPTILDILQLAVNDYIQLGVWHNRGSNLDISAGSQYTFLSLAKIA